VRWKFGVKFCGVFQLYIVASKIKNKERILSGSFLKKNGKVFNRRKLGMQVEFQVLEPDRR
jgi:hypothetical protein